MLEAAAAIAASRAQRIGRGGGAAEADRREPQATLGDVGEITEAAGVEHGAGQVGIAAGDEVDQRQQGQRQERRRERQPGPVSGVR